MTGLLLLLAIGGVIYWLALVAWTIRALMKPPRQTYASAVARGRPGDPSELDDARPFSAWTLRSQGRDLAVWDIEGHAAEGPVAIITHGWGSGKVNALVRVPTLTPLCSRIVLWDQPGHGESGGACTLGVREAGDLVALVERVGRDRQIVLAGSSMGAGLCIAAASQCPHVSLVVAEAPYVIARTPARNVMRLRRAPVAMNLSPAMAWIGLVAARRWTGPSLDVPPDRPFDRTILARRVQCSLVVLHGDEDQTCPIEDGRAIASAASEGRFVEISGGTHQNLWKDPACRATMEREYTTAIRSITDA